MCGVHSVYAVNDEVIFNEEQNNKVAEEKESVAEKDLIEEDISEEDVATEEDLQRDDSEIRNEELKEDQSKDEKDTLTNNLDLLNKTGIDLELTVSLNDGNIYHSFKDITGDYYLYLPSQVDLNNVFISYNVGLTHADSIDIDIENKTLKWNGNTNVILYEGEKIYNVYIQKSELPSCSVKLNGTTLETINSGSKDIKYKGNSITIASQEGSYADNDIELKGRGNHSWTLEKKSYQFKLSSKENLLGLGKAKTWLLIANHGDASLMRNKLTYDLASEVGLDYSIQSRYVDLWVDGEYIGNYLLCEKVQVNTNRVELEQEDGLLVEMDNNYYQAEDYWFQSERSGGHFVLKDSVADDVDENDSHAVSAFREFEKYMNLFEEKLYSDQKNWDEIKSLIDVDSFVKYYFINEFTENADGVRSSMNLYMDGKDDVLHLGPVWDFDLSIGNCFAEEYGGLPNVNYMMNANDYNSASLSWYRELFKIPEFQDVVVSTYLNQVKPILSTYTEKIKSYTGEIRESANVNFKRWDVLGNTNLFGAHRGHQYLDSHEEEVNYLNDWLSKRLIYMNSYYTEDYDFDGLVNYQTHIQRIGWQDIKKDGLISGTVNQGLRIESIKISLRNDIAGDIEYQPHVQGYGWKEWVKNGEEAGTEGEGKRIEAIRIKLAGTVAEEYDVYYRVHAQTYGWLGWAKNGEEAGTQGMSKRLEAIQIRLVKKGDTVPGSIENHFVKPMLSYQTHVQTYGWQNAVNDWMVTGTEGEGKRLEAIKIDWCDSTIDKEEIQYKTHVQTYGWLDWVSGGQVSGTENESKRLEAIKIQLTGEMGQNYDIYYRVHAQTYGWLGWAKNGEEAGTEGMSKRLEAIQIQLVEKGGEAPGSTENRFLVA